jgi:hypothetical protein
MLLETLFMAAILSTPNGKLIKNETTCYTTTVQKAEKSEIVGYTLQAIERSKVGDREVFKILIHQRMFGGKFDMRDSFIVDAQDLRAIEFMNERQGKQQVRLSYGNDKIRGTRMKADGATEAIEIAIPGPIWDANLWGLTFAALPLETGAQLSLPTFHYDKGRGEFNINVKGLEADIWQLEVGAEGQPKAHYQIGQSPRRELGVKAGPYTSFIGGDCTGLGPNTASKPLM